MTTDLNQFVQDAIRTESTIEKIEVNPALLLNVMFISIAAGNMLDQIKKHVFYGKDYSPEMFIGAFAGIISALDQLKPAIEGLQRNPGADSNEEEFNVDPRLFHAIIGIATEATELLEALDGDMDLVNIQEELGDLNWYQAIAIDSIEGASFDNVLDTVINKLKERYPEKFTSEDAINRDLDNERQTLEDNLNS